MTNSNTSATGRGPGATLTPDAMARVTAADFAELQKIARRYCRAVDATRSRKRMDGSATSTRGGRGKYGTDDVSDDVTQDAVLIFATRLDKIVTTCDVAAVWVATRDPAAWAYVRRDGGELTVTRATLHYWAVRDAAARNGYRLDVRPSDVDATPGAVVMRGVPHADKVPTLAARPVLAGRSEEIFRRAWGDGADFPTLSTLLHVAEKSDDLGRRGAISETARKLYGGPRYSSSKVQRVSDSGRREYRALTRELDAVRDDLVYRSMQPRGDA